MKDYFYLVLGVALIVWSFYAFLQKPAPAHYQPQGAEQSSASPILRVGDRVIDVEVADTDAERVLGLSGRESLPKNTGLLFLFDTPAIYSFWMKDMKFAIDIVWIDENWEVISVDHNVPPETFPQSFSPTRSARYVLELNSGDALALGIDTGARVFFGTEN